MELHAGGVDLKFPHHTNEIAQAEAYHNMHKSPSEDDKEVSFDFMSYIINTCLFHFLSSERNGYHIGYTRGIFILMDRKCQSLLKTLFLSRMSYVIQIVRITPQELMTFGCGVSLCQGISEDQQHILKLGWRKLR